MSFSDAEIPKPRDPNPQRMQVTLSKWQMFNLLEQVADQIEHSSGYDGTYRVRLQTLYDTLQGVYDDYLKAQDRSKAE